MLAALLLAGVACASEPVPTRQTAPPAEDSSVIIETIEQNTVGDLDGVRQPMGNMTTGEYSLPDGSTRVGPICSLPIEGRVGVFVGVGSVVDVGGSRWEVVDVSLGQGGEPGSVSLKKLDD